MAYWLILFLGANATGLHVGTFANLQACQEAVHGVWASTAQDSGAQNAALTYVCVPSGSL